MGEAMDLANWRDLRVSAKVRVSFSKSENIVQNGFVFVRKAAVFARVVLKIAKSASKRFHFGAGSQLRRRFWA
ncbi:MAG: hypothetical protein IID32_02900 [Planctomycetes bacterium]|nr:hypothetical protein [Planctomycetota bacterium]